MSRIAITSPRIVSPPRVLVLPADMSGVASIRGDGSDDSIIGTFPPALAGQQPLTMAGWFRPSGTGHATVRMPFCVGLPAVGRKVICLMNELVSGSWLWGLGTWESFWTFADMPVQFLQWTPVVLRHTGATNTPCTLNVGPAQRTGTTNFTPNWTAGYASIFEESRGAAVYDFGGHVWDCRLYNRQWTDEEVAAFRRGEPVSAANLLRRWKCEAIAAGKTLEDIGGTLDTVTGAVLDTTTAPFRPRTAAPARDAA